MNKSPNTDTLAGLTYQFILSLLAFKFEQICLTLGLARERNGRWNTSKH